MAYAFELMMAPYAAGHLKMSFLLEELGYTLQKDENVFDIQQGVSIVLFIKKEKKDNECKIFYQDIYGLRESKYNYLIESDFHTTEWKELKPMEPY